MYTRTFNLSGIEVFVTYKNVRRLNLRVSAAGAVTMSVPLMTSDAIIQAFLREKLGWIQAARQQARTGIRASSLTIEGVGEVRLTRSRGSRLKLRVLPPHGEVDVAVPAGCTEDQVRAFVAECLDYIRETRAKLPQQCPAGAGLDSGTPFLLWGEELTLRVEEGEPPYGVRRQGKTLVLRTGKGAGLAARRDLLRHFLVDCVLEALPAIRDRYEKLLRVRARTWSCTYMTSRWGSCNARTGRINLNADLARHPKFVLEYIVVHELCHLLQRGHQDNFYALVDRFFPRRSEADAYLKKVVLALQ